MKFTTRAQDDDPRTNLICATLLSVQNGRGGGLDGGTIIVKLYFLTVSTTTNIRCISMVSGIHYHLSR